MTSTLHSAIAAQVGWTWRDHVGAAPIIDSNQLRFQQNLGDGSQPGQADAVWHAENLALAAGQSITLRLSALQQELFGGTITIPMGRVKAVLIINRSESAAGCLMVGGAAADPWHAPFGSPGDKVKVMPESPLLLAGGPDGWEVWPGSTDLEITAVGGDAGFDVAILGTLSAGSSSSSSA